MTKTAIVKGLGEVALRVNDLQRMKRFYQEVFGLNELGDFPDGALLKIASGHAGRTQVLGLFDRSASVAQPQTTLDHLAFEIDLIDYEAETRRLQGLGLDVTVREHNWIKWRSLYFHDPEGNRVELVCYDESISSESH
jgi:catechol 2,3-dioxygenase-like lactoylglutathione lyase family enzyme